MRARKLICLLLCAVILCAGAFASEAPYHTMTELHNGREAYTLDGYLPDEVFREFDGEYLDEPSDIFIDEYDNLFISDTDNDRVIMATTEGDTLKVFEGRHFKSVGGIFVRDGKLYATDIKQRTVYVYDIESGEIIFELVHPETALYGLNAKFEPLKVAVDAAGNIYVISKGNTNGIAQFSSDGTFLGYFGANETTLSLSEKLKRLTYTQEQLDQLKRVIPATPESLDMDARGLIYTVTPGVKGVKRLNMAGVNIMEPMTWGFDNTKDIAVGAQENIFTVSQDGYIMEYTRDGRVLFYFGGNDATGMRNGLFKNAVAIDVDSHGRLYVLDNSRNLVQRFEITDYAALVHEGLALYQDGLYAESREPWEEVLELNSLFDYAQMGLGRSYYKLEMYDEALRASRLGGDKQGYSDSYWEIRNVWLQNNIIWIIGALIALKILSVIWKKLKKCWKPAMAYQRFTDKVRGITIVKQLGFITYFPKNPADAFYGVKHEGKVSVFSSTLLYIAVVVIYIVNKYYCGFLFKTVEDGRFNVGMDLIMVIGLIALFLIACNLICSIRDGEGTFKQMYCSLAYALGPYILLKPLSFLLSFVLTYNEAFLITLVDLIAIALCFMLIVMMVKSLQNYNFRETFVTLLLTVFTMLMIVIALVISFALIMQLWEFITSVWKEARFYNEK